MPYIPQNHANPEEAFNHGYLWGKALYLQSLSKNRFLDEKGVASKAAQEAVYQKRGNYPTLDGESFVRGAIAGYFASA